MNECNITQPLYGPCAAAHASLLQVIACSCKSDSPCSKMHCSCRSSRLSCTSYSKCDNETCCNQTGTAETSDNDEEAESDAQQLMLRQMIIVTIVEIYVDVE